VDDFRPLFADTFAAITASLVVEPEVGAVLVLVTEACTTLLGAAAAGVILVDPRGGTEVVAATDERATLVELLQSQLEQGPCVDCIREDTVISDLDLHRARLRWPQFAPAAVAAGYGAVIAVPMRLEHRPVGGLNLLYADPPPVQGWRGNVARALADLAVLALVQDRGQRRANRLVVHTLATVNDRAHQSQAIGMVAAATGLDPDQARVAVRAYALQVNLPLPQVARAITDTHLDPAALIQAVARPQPDA
jgi:GAF domain-containing protein